MRARSIVRIAPVVILVVLLIAACKLIQEIFGGFRVERYFPLAVGASWTYEGTITVASRRNP